MLGAPLERPTSLLSAQLLASATAGRFSEPLLELQKALAPQEGLSALVLSAARHVLRAGHTTGRSALLGLIVPVSGRELECIGEGLSMMHERTTCPHSLWERCSSWSRSARRTFSAQEAFEALTLPTPPQKQPRNALPDC